MNSIYDVLGISSEASIREIKRAYAARLKQCDQEASPEAFQSLRQAYELATAHALHRACSEEQAPLLPHEGGNDGADLSPKSAPLESNIVIQPEAIKQNEFENAVNNDELAIDVAESIIKELEADYKTQASPPPKELLRRYSSSEQLVSFPDRERFEQLLLNWIFVPPIKTEWLDAATQFFSWETANRHLLDCRPDLVWRMKRHADLRHLIDAIPEIKNAVADGKYYFDLQAAREAQGIIVGVPFSVIRSLAKLLETIEATYPREAEERFGEKMAYWKRIALTEGGKTAAPVEQIKPAPLKLINLAFLLPFLALINAGINGKIPSSPPPVRSMPVKTQAYSEKPSDVACPYTDEQLRQIIRGEQKYKNGPPAQCELRIMLLEINSPPNTTKH